MKMRFIRRVGAGVTVFVLVVLTLISARTSYGVTFAWMGGRSSIPAEDFTMVNLGMEYKGGSLNVKKFLDTPYATQNHMELVNHINAGEAEDAFSNWIATNGNNEEILADADIASQYCMIFREYTLENTSDIPVFFRISRACLSGESPDILLAALYGTKSEELGPAEGALIPDGDWFYCDQPLYPGDTISVTFAAYIMGMDSGNLTFSADLAEIIQGPNNALYISDGWKYAAEKFELAVGAAE